MVVEGRARKGGGVSQAIVDEEGRLHTEADTRPIEEEVNEEFAKTFTISIDGIDPTDAGDYLLYVKNTGEKQIELYAWKAKVTGAAGVITLDWVTGTSDGSTVTPVNNHLGRPETLNVNAESGVNIVTLANAGTLDEVTLLVDLTETSKLSAHVVMPKDTAVAWRVSSATAVTSIVAYFFERQDA